MDFMATIIYIARGFHFGIFLSWLIQHHVNRLSLKIISDYYTLNPTIESYVYLFSIFVAVVFFQRGIVSVPQNHRAIIVPIQVPCHE